SISVKPRRCLRRIDGRIRNPLLKGTTRKGKSADLPRYRASTGTTDPPIWLARRSTDGWLLGNHHRLFLCSVEIRRSARRLRNDERITLCRKGVNNKMRKTNEKVRVPERS